MIERRLHKKYINFKMRKKLKSKILENTNISDQEAEQLAEILESMVCENYWIKDKSKVQILTKVA